MNVDERSRRAVADLVERASARPVPSIDELDQSPRRSRRLMGAAAAALLLVAGLAVIATRDDDSVRTITTLLTPRGVEAKELSPRGLGITLDVPSTWVEGGAVAGFGHSIGDSARDGYVLADRVRNVEDLDVDAVGSNRAAGLQAFGAADISTVRSTSVVGVPSRCTIRLQQTIPA